MTMIKELLKNKTKNIGLDIGANSIKMVQMEQYQDQLRVYAADKAQIKKELEGEEQQAAIIDAVKGMLGQGCFKGRNVVASIPNSAITVKSLRVDSIEEKDINEMINNDVARQLGLDPEEDEIRYILAGKVHHSGELKDEVIFLGAKRDVIKSHIEILTSAGAVPVGIDPIACALMRSFSRSLRRQSDQSQVNFYIDIGSQYTTVLIGNNHQISFIKHIPIAGDRINEEVSKKLNVSVDDAYLLRLKLRQTNDTPVNNASKQAIVDAMTNVIEELVHEVSLCFRYYAVTFRGTRPSKVLLTGGEAYEENLSAALNKQLNLDIEVAQPLRGVDTNKAQKLMDEGAALSEWAVATGLSLKGHNFNNNSQKSHERN